MATARPSYLSRDSDAFDKAPTDLVPMSALDKTPDWEGDATQQVPPVAGPFRTYRRRQLGLLAILTLNIISAANWVLFSTVTDQTSAYFASSLTKINWLSNIVCALYLVMSWVVPVIVERYSIRASCMVCSVFLVLGVWLRYAAAFVTDKPASAYALLFIGSVCIGVAQPCVQIIGPAFSETWFTPRGRTTVTMLIAVANPFGAAVGDLLAPAIVPDNPKGGEVRTLLLVMGIATSVAAFATALVRPRPPTPPSLTASRKRETLWEACRAMIGVRSSTRTEHITRRHRIDFAIIVYVGGIFVAFFDAYSTLLNQIYAPYGYSSDASGFFGAAAILCGLVAAAITAPIFDRYLTSHFAIVAKSLVPLLGVVVLSFVWAVKPDDYAGIYFLNIVFGVGCFILLPVALELGVEVTSTVMSPESSTAIIYLSGNALTVVAIVVMDALRAGPDASPPLNMRRALIFQGVVALVSSLFILGLKGEQQRRRKDEGHL